MPCGRVMADNLVPAYTKPAACLQSSADIAARAVRFKRAADGVQQRQTDAFLVAGNWKR